MITTIKLSDQLINEANRYAEISGRSIPQQIEYWSHIGKIAEENPDLPYSFIKDILVGLQEIKDHQTNPYEFD